MEEESRRMVNSWRNWFSIGLTVALVVLVALPVPAAGASLPQAADLQARADRLFDEGLALFRQEQWSEALAKFQAALPLYQQTNDAVGEPDTHFFIGNILYTLHDFEPALVHYQQALRIYQKNGEQWRAAAMLHNIGDIHRLLGAYADALDYYQRGLATLAASACATVTCRNGQGSGLSSLGWVYSQIGQYEQALDAYQGALDIHRSLELLPDQLRALSGIAAVHFEVGRYEAALTTYDEALDLLVRRVPALATGQEVTLDPVLAQALGTILSGIGSVYFQLNLYEQAGRYDEMIEFYSLALLLHQRTGNTRGEASVLHNLATVLVLSEDYTQAQAVYQRALTLARTMSNRSQESSTLAQLGELYSRLGKETQSVAALQQSVALARATGDPTLEAVALRQLAAFYEYRGQYTQAISYAKQAITSIETVQGAIKTEELASAYAGQHTTSGIYRHLIGLLWQTGRFAEAFHYAERARARAFLNQVGNQRVDFRRAADPALIEREETLRQKMIGLQNLLTAERTNPVDQQEPATLDLLAAELAEARLAYSDLLIDLKLNSPEYAALLTVDALTLDEVRRQVVDGETTLIEYFILGNTTLVWVIDKQGSNLVALDIGDDELSNKIEFLRAIIADRDFDADTAAELYDRLFAPLQPHIRNANLVIVPHGVLHYLPFAALWNAETERFLVEEYTLTYAPSASALKFILAKRNSNEGRLLALGNPDDSLPQAEAEVKAVAQRYGARPLLRRQATESQFRSAASQADIIHLAAHAVYNPYNPLYTRIELAPDRQNDGNLEVHEIFGLELTGANLVVLSACETALGEQSSGDELVGLTRAFLYAGAPAVVTTLWSIEDEASAALMASFYGHLRTGMTNAEALRAAQIEVLEQERWQLAYYWAAFTLTGDWRGSEQ